MKKHRPSSQAGLTLLEMTIAVGISVLLAGGIAVYIRHFDDTRYRIEAMGTRDALALRLRRVINKSNLSYSAANFNDPGNVALRACVNPLATGGCKALSASVPVTFFLAYPRGAGNALQPISGTQGAPVLYKHNGEICTTAAGCNAEWEVRTYFKAMCAYSQPNCDVATDIRVGFSIDNVNLRGQNLLPSAPPSSPNDRTSRVFFTVKISDPPQATNPCSVDPTGAPTSFPVSKDAKGNFVCKCIPGATQIGTAANGQPICQALPITCPAAGQIPIGFDQNMQPMCVARLVCRTLPVDATCNGFINSVRVGGCSVSTSANKKKKKGDGDNSTTCTQNSYQCCTAQ